MRNEIIQEMPKPQRQARRNGGIKRGCFDGNDLISSVTVPANSQSGLVIARIDICPSKFPGTSLWRQAQLYANWKPARKLKIVVQPSAGTTTSGSYIMGWTMDSGLDIPTGDNAVRTVATFEKRQTAKIYEKKELNIPLKTVQSLLFCDASKEDSDQGTFYLVLSSGIGNLTAGSVVSFNIYIDYDVDFENRLATPDTSDAFIYPAEGFSSYFTDNGDGVTKLSLKHQEGQALVPFHQSLPEAVYQFIGKSLKFCKTGQNSATATGVVTHAVRIRGRSDGALYVFENLTKAQAYANTGDDANCITYVAAGPWVDPTGAGFKLVSSPSALYSNRLN
jgi:hypothetical protein